MAAHATLADRTASDAARAEAARLLGATPPVSVPRPVIVKALTQDEEDAERWRRIALDPGEPDWKRQAARDQLAVMGMQPRPPAGTPRSRSARSASSAATPPT